MSWKRSIETKKRYKKLHKKTVHSYGAGVWYDEERGRYIRYWQPRRAKFLKRKCNREVRRYKGSLPAKGTYRRVSEFWYEMW